MALDGKAIKEEIPDKEVYESGNGRRNKGELETKRDCFPFLPLIGIINVLCCKLYSFKPINHLSTCL